MKRTALPGWTDEEVFADLGLTQEEVDRLFGPGDCPLQLLFNHSTNACQTTTTPIAATANQ